MNFLIHRHQNGCGQSSLNDGFQAEIRGALHTWRGHMAHGSELAVPFDLTDDHFRGDPEAAVQVVEYGSVGSIGESQDDRALRQTIAVWLQEGRVCLAFRHFPLVDSQRGVWLAARALEASAVQCRFWDLYDALTDLQTRPWAKDLDAATLRSVAHDLKLDVDRLSSDMDAPKLVAKILRDFRGGLNSGVNGAPTFYVQGIRQDIDGPDELAHRIESAIAGDVAALWPPVHAPATQSDLDILVPAH